MELGDLDDPLFHAIIQCEQKTNDNQNFIVEIW